MGRIHGESLRADIIETMGRWKAALSENSGLTADEFVERFLDATDFGPAIERSTPNLMEEVRGIAEGSGASFRDVYAYQLIDEQWIFMAQLQRERGPASQEHCTAMGIFERAGGPPILAQNMDLPKYYDGSQTLLYLCAPDSHTNACVWTIAGLLGAMGVNERGVGVCCNTVSQLRSSRDGLPVVCVIRKILEQPTRPSAVAFVKSVHHASGQNYTIGGPDGITSLECSANQAVEYLPLPGRVFHTNHPVVNDELEPIPAGSQPPAADPITGRQKTNSETRFSAVQSALGEAGTDLTVRDVQAVLGNPETLVCALREGATPSFTITSMVAELSVPPQLCFAPGPPSSNEYRTYPVTPES